MSSEPLRVWKNGRHGTVEVVDLAEWGEGVEVEDDSKIGVLARLSFRVDDEDELVTIELASKLGDKRVLTRLEPLLLALRNAKVVP